MTELAKKFEFLAGQAAAEHKRLLLVEKSREHARPLLTLLNEIKKFSIGLPLHINEYSTAGGSIVFQVGLHDGQTYNGNNWEKINSMPDGQKLINLFVEPDGNFSAVRWDLTKEDKSIRPDGGGVPTQTFGKELKEIASALALWIENNVPEIADKFLSGDQSAAKDARRKQVIKVFLDNGYDFCKRLPDNAPHQELISTAQSPTYLVKEDEAVAVLDGGRTHFFKPVYNPQPPYNGPPMFD